MTPLFASPEELAVDVTTPAGEILPIDSPELIDRLRPDTAEDGELRLIRCDRPLTDCRPVSLISLQTIRHISDEIGRELDARQFRANIIVDLESGAGFGEDSLVGRTVQIGHKAVVVVLERDPRCKMITIDPETGDSDPTVLRYVTQERGGLAGVYAALLAEGMVRIGDKLELLS